MLKTLLNFNIRALLIALACAARGTSTDRKNNDGQKDDDANEAGASTAASSNNFLLAKLLAEALCNRQTDACEKQKE